MDMHVKLGPEDIEEAVDLLLERRKMKRKGKVTVTKRTSGFGSVDLDSLELDAEQVHEAEPRSYPGAKLFAGS